MCNRERGEKKNESMTITIFDIYASDEQVEMKHFDIEFSVAAMVFVASRERERERETELCNGFVQHLSTAACRQDFNRRKMSVVNNSRV